MPTTEQQYSSLTPVDQIRAYEMAVLARSAYTNIGNVVVALGQTGPLTADAVAAAFETSLIENGVSQQDAAYISSRFEVVAAEDVGLSITGNTDNVILFRDRSSGEQIVAAAGTNHPADFLDDIRLATGGIAEVAATTIRVYNDWVADGTINTSSPLSTAGHSMGGHIAQSIAFVHAAISGNLSSIFAFNSPGHPSEFFFNPDTGLLEPANGVDIAGKTVFITNSDGFEIVSAVGSRNGDEIFLPAGEKYLYLPTYTDIPTGDSHSIDRLVDFLKIDLLQGASADPTLVQFREDYSFATISDDLTAETLALAQANEDFRTAVGNAQQTVDDYFENGGPNFGVLSSVTLADGTNVEVTITGLNGIKEATVSITNSVDPATGAPTSFTETRYRQTPTGETFVDQTSETRVDPATGSSFTKTTGNRLQPDGSVVPVREATITVEVLNSGSVVTYSDTREVTPEGNIAIDIKRIEELQNENGELDIKGEYIQGLIDSQTQDASQFHRISSELKAQVDSLVNDDVNAFQITKLDIENSITKTGQDALAALNEEAKADLARNMASALAQTYLDSKESVLLSLLGNNSNLRDSIDTGAGEFDFVFGGAGNDELLGIEYTSETSTTKKFVEFLGTTTKEHTIDGSGIDVVKVTDSAGNITYEAEFAGTNISIGALGSIFGSTLGRQLAGSNPFAQIAAGTITGVVVDNLVETLAFAFEPLEGNFGSAFDQAFDDFGANLGNATVGAVSSFLTGELVGAIGLDGFEGELANAIGGSAIGQIANNIVFEGFDAATANLNVNGALGSFLGTKLAGAIISPNSIEGQLGFSLGSAVGALVFTTEFGKVLGSFLAPGIGAFVGALAGGLIGSLLAGTPDSGVYVYWDEASGEFKTLLDGQSDPVTGKKNWDADKGSRELARGMAESARDILNGVVAALGAGGAELLNGDVVAGSAWGQHGRDGNLPRVRFWPEGRDNADSNYPKTTDYAEAIGGGVGHNLSQLAFIGGDLYARRAFYANAANYGNGEPYDYEPVTMFGDLAIAADYAAYQESAAVINFMIAINPQSAFAAGWAITLQRANELGLDRYGESDLLGGLQSLLPFELPAGTNFADVSIAWADNDEDGQSDDIVITIDGQSRTITIDDFALTMGLNAGSSSDYSDIRIHTGTNGVNFTDTNTTGPTGSPLQYIGPAGDASDRADDNFRSLTSDDIFVGGSGNDTLSGKYGWDWLDGGAGDDSIEGGVGNDVLLGRAGNDALNGGDGNDTLGDGAGADDVDGGAGDDVILVAQDSDIDTFDGGAGADTASYADWNTAVSINMASAEGLYGDVYLNIENVAGSHLADTITGDGAANILSGLGGADTLDGGAGDDTLVGGAGADDLRGGDGVNTASYADATSGVQVNLGAGGTGGDAEGDSYTNIQNLQGSESGDQLQGDDNANHIAGGGGNDILLGSAGGDSYDGGDGFDIVDYSNASVGVVVNLQVGNAISNGGNVSSGSESTLPEPPGTGPTTPVVTARSTLTGTANDDFLVGDQHNNVVLGEEGDDILYGGGGHDKLGGNSGDDKLFGGDGRDTLYGSTGSDQVDGGTGDDILYGGLGNDVIWGRQGDDIVYAGPGDDVIYGHEGNDQIYGGDGLDTVYAADGDDIVRGQGGDDVLFGGEGYDSIEGGAGNDKIFGGGQADVLFGNEGNDFVGGTDHNDTLSDGTGIDTLFGTNGDDVLKISDDGFADTFRGGNANVDDGVDTASFSDWSRGIVIDLSSKNNEDFTIFDGNNSIQGVENLILTGHQDLAVGDELDNVIQGLGGEDILKGSGGNDTIYGDEESDNIDGGSGNDKLIGGRGYGDTFEFNGAWGNDTIEDYEPGRDTLSFVGDFSSDDLIFEEVTVDTDGDGVHETTHTRIRIENPAFSASVLVLNVKRSEISASSIVVNTERVQTADDDLIEGTSSNDAIWAGEGNDTVFGGAGDDTIGGGAGDDKLFGGAGNDIIFGSTGNDFAAGGAGGDFIFGGDNVDTLLGGSGDDEVWGSEGDDVISDGSGRDILVGKGGNDKFILANDGTKDVVSGENYFGLELADGEQLGRDLVSYEEWDIAVAIDLAIAHDAEKGQLGDVFFGIDDLLLTARSDFGAGDSKSNMLIGGAGDDTLHGREGNDTLEGGSGDDKLNGGLGNDFLIGGSGQTDIYIFDPGWGHDTIRDFDRDNDVLNIDATGLQPDQLTLTLQGNNTILSDASNENTITLLNVQITMDEIDFGFTIGNDTHTNIEGIIGSAYNDRLLASDAGSWLAGGGGNDTLIGGEGDDSFVINLGGGTDTFEARGGFDSIVIGAGAGFADLRLENIVEGASHITTLTVDQSGTAKLVTTSGVYGGAFEQIVLSNGYNLSVSGTRYIEGEAVLSGLDKISNGSASADHISPLAQDNNFERSWLAGWAGNDSLYGSMVNDVLHGGTGDDYLAGHNGSDTYLYSIGDGHDTIFEVEGKKDTLVFDEGIKREDLSFEWVETGGNRSLKINVDPENGARGSITINTWTKAGGAGRIEWINVGGVNLNLPREVHLDESIVNTAPVPDLRENIEFTFTNGFIGSEPIATFQATDADGDPLFYNASGNDNFWFVGNQLQAALGTTIEQFGVLAITVSDGLSSVHSEVTITLNSSGTVSGDIESRLPVVFDLDGDGVELISFYTSTVLFDMDNDGVRERTGWVGPDDGLLVLDRNLNGLIDDANEISFVNDFAGANSDIEGLQAYDTNFDGKLDANDDAYDQFQIWRDVNSDGVSQNNELFKLEELGITEISLDIQRAGQILEGAVDNAITGTVSYTAANGFVGEAADVSFVYDGGDGLALTPIIEALGADLIGGSGPDTITGGLGNDTLRGGGGADILRAGQGDDLLIGDISNDTLKGNIGDDTLRGNDGDDVISGGSGNDKLTGGSEADSFSFDAAWGTDTIIDFAIGEDKIDLSSTDFIYSDLTITQVGTDTEISDGNGNVIILSGIVASTITATDFVFDNIETIRTDPEVLIDDSVATTSHFTWNENGLTYSYTGTSTARGGRPVETDVSSGKWYWEQTIDVSNSNNTWIGLVAPISTDWSAASRTVSEQSNVYFYESSGRITEGTGSGRTNLFDSHSSRDFDAGDVIGVAYDADAGNLWISINGVWLEGATDTDVENGLNPTISNIPSGAYQPFAGGSSTVSGNTHTVTLNFGATTFANAAPTGFADYVETDPDAAPPQIIGTAQNDSIVGTDEAEVISGKAGDDTLEGANGDDVLDGGEGNDALEGGDGSDLLLGNSGNDWLIGGAGADTLDGGEGLDWTRYDTAVGAISINFATGEHTGVDGDVLLNIEGVYGSTFGDTLVGSSNNEGLQGGEGQDLLVGGAGNDTLWGNAQSDTLDGGEGDDTLIGGASNDVFVFSAGWGTDTVGDFTKSVDTIDLTALGLQFSDLTITQVGSHTEITEAGGNKIILSGVTASTIDAGDFVFANSIKGTSVNDDLNVGVHTGNLTIYGLGGSDLASYYHTGQNGNSGIVANLMTNTVTHHGGVDTLVDVERVQGGFGADSLVGGDGNDAFYGHDGDDTLVGGKGNDTLRGDQGSDLLVYENTWGVDTVLDFTRGEDTLDLSSTALQFSDLTITQVGAHAEITDGAGNKIILRDTTATTIDASDFVFVNAITGTAATDILLGTSASDRIDGLAGDDDIYGEGGEDTLIGGSGNDRFYEREGSAPSADNIDGGDGIDIVNYLNALTGVNVNLSTGVSSGAADGDTYVNVEQFYGSNHNDSIVGGGQFNYLHGQDGDDTIEGGVASEIILGGAGNDRLSGGDGHDDIYGDSGADTLSGGAGHDRFYERDGAAPQADYIDGGSGTDIVNYLNALTGVNVNLSTGVSSGAADGDTYVDVEQFYGSNYNDTIDGGSQFTVLNGQGGDDLIKGGEASETIFGGAGNDSLSGGSGDDVLRGEAGDDTYVFFGGWGFDTVTGFTKGEDTLNLTGTSLQFADLTITQVGAHTEITEVGGNKIILENVTATTIDATDFVFANVITGTVNNDMLIGTTESDLIEGLAGKDVLNGGNGDDTLVGGDDHDNLNGGLGSNVLDGGVGHDLATYAWSSVGIVANLATGTVIHEGGTDTLVSIGQVAGSDGGADNITGDNLGNSFYGHGGNDTIYGNGGNDYLGGGSGDDQLFGGDGNDNLVANGGNDTLKGEAGTDDLRGGDGDDNILGGDSFDYLTGGLGADTLDGGDGHDHAYYTDSTSAISINLTSGVNIGGEAEGDVLISIGVIHGTAFGDSFVGDGAWTTFFGGAGNDTLKGEGGEDNLLGEDGDDILDGGSGNDTLSGGSGSDIFVFAPDWGTDTIIDFVSGADKLDLSAIGLQFTDLTITQVGADTQITETGGNIIVLTGVTATTLTTSDFVFANVITGTDNNDTLIGTAAAEIINALDGNDQIFAGTGVDFIDGGIGYDVVRYSNASSGITLDLSNIANNTGDAAGDAYVNVESFHGSAYNDTLIGDSGDNIIAGGDGDDSINAGLGNDIVNGQIGNDYLSLGDGNDSVHGSVGSDTIDGGSGNDVVQYVNSTTGIVLDLANTANNTGDAAGDTYVNIESFQGSEYNDSLRGDVNDNVLAGRSGDDVIEGYAGNDYLDGQNGNDILDGGSGNDTLSGGSGSDIFAFASDWGTDTIIDFVSGADKLNLSETGLQFTDLTITQVGANTEITDAGGNKVILTGVTATTLDPSDFSFESVPVQTTVRAGEVLIDSSVSATNQFSWNSNGLTFSYTSSGTNPRGGRPVETDVSSGKWYWEQTIDASSSNRTWVGLIAPITTDWDASSSSVYKQPDVYMFKATGEVFAAHNLVANDSAFAFGAGDVIGVAYDADAGKLWISKNGAWLGGASDADVAAGLNTTISNVPSGTYQPFASAAGGISGDSQTVTFNFGVTDFAHAVPSGFTDYVETTPGSGHDVVGSPGNDAINGTTDADSISGMFGDDTIDGAAGDDTIAGGLGDDQLTGGAGADAFSFGAGWGEDTITDFTSGIDTIDMVGADVQFVDLTITQVGMDTQITDGSGNKLILTGVSATTIGESDFAFKELFAPVVTVDPLTTNDATPLITGTIDDPTASIEITVEGQTYTGTNAGDGTWSAQVTETLESSDYPVFYRAVGRYGHTSTHLPEVTGFVELSGTDNPLNLVAASTSGTLGWSKVEFADVDNDGDLDAVVGTYDTNIMYFENTGDADNPDFVHQTGAANPFDHITGSILKISLLDADNDGDMDAFVGAAGGTFRFFENVGNASTANYVELLGAGNPLDGVDVGNNAGIVFADLDNDGDLDGVSSDGAGRLYYFENTGTANSMTLTQAVAGSGAPFDGVDVGSMSSVGFVDLDGDGDLDAFSGVSTGVFNYYENTGSADSPSFVQRTGNANLFNGMDFGSHSTVAFADLDRDGFLEAYIGFATKGFRSLDLFGSGSDITIDTQAPIVTVDAAAAVQASFPIVTGTVDDPDAVITLNYATQNYAAANNGDGTWTVTLEGSLSAGSYGFDVSATDALGNEGTGSLAFDIKPTVTIDVLATSDTTPTITGTIDDPTATIEVIINSKIYSGVNNSDGTWFADIGSELTGDILSEGEYTVHYKIMMVSGNVYYGGDGIDALSENIGTDNPFEGVDVGTNSKVAVADLDGDGDLDVFVGEGDGNINYFENIGNSDSPVYIEITGISNPFNGVDVGSLSSVAFGDIDNDGDLDALIGESDGTVNFFRNDGNANNALMVAATGSANPLNGIDVGSQSDISLADIDNDGDLDVFLGGADGTIHLYRNDGNSDNPVFVNVVGAENPFDGIDIGTDSTVSFVDVDGDFDLDAFTGGTSTPRYFENIGTREVPEYIEVTGSANIFSGISLYADSKVEAADLNGDGLPEILAGQANGQIRYFSANYSPSLVVDTTAPSIALDIGQPSYPIVSGIVNDPATTIEVVLGGTTYVGVNNGDGTWTADVSGALVSGSHDFTVTSTDAQGNVASINASRYIAPIISLNGLTTRDNTPILTGTVDDPAAAVSVQIEGQTYAGINNSDGTWSAEVTNALSDGSYEIGLTATDASGVTVRIGSSIADFASVTGSNNPFNGIDVGGRSDAYLADIDNDGDLDAFFGDTSGAIKYYQNTGTVGDPVFTFSTGSANPFDGADIGLYSNISFIDADADGDLDAFIGDSDGIINYFENTGNSDSPLFVERTGPTNPFNGVDVGGFSYVAFADIDGDGDFDAFLGESNGTIKYYENTGNSDNPTFVEVMGEANPFDGIDVGTYSSVGFVDFDGDGDQDAFLGSAAGDVSYYENIGNVSSAQFEPRTGADNPFGGVNVGSLSSVAFGDVNGDGLQDAIIGEHDGILNYYRAVDADNPTLFIDATAPAVGFDPGTTLQSTYPIVTGTVDDVDTVIEVIIEGQTFAAVNNGNGTWSADVSGVLVSGAHNLEVRAIDTLGNIGTNSISMSFAPLVTLGPLSTQDTTPTLIGTIDDPSASIEVTVDGTAYTGVNHGDGTWEATVTTALTQGDYSVLVKATDAAGNVGYNERISVGYTEKTGAGNPLDGIDVGSYASPAFGDMDGDGDFDMVVGESNAVAKYYENTGTNINPVFVERTGAANPFDGFDFARARHSPTLVDIDADGDQDVFIGHSGNGVEFLRNDGTSSTPQFTHITGAANPFDGAPVVSSVKVSFTDLDNDGDLDAFWGQRSGIILYFRNDGSSTAPQFNNVQSGSAADPINWRTAGYVPDYSKPVFFDVDGDGDRDVLVGQEHSQGPAYFENQGTVDDPSFMRITSGPTVFQADWGTIYRSDPAFVDIDGDTLAEIVVGDSQGILRFYEASTVELTIQPAPAAKAATAPPPVAAAVADNEPVIAALSVEATVVMPSKSELKLVSEDQLREGWIQLREENGGVEPTRAQLARVLSGLVVGTGSPAEAKSDVNGADSNPTPSSSSASSLSTVADPLLPAFHGEEKVFDSLHDLDIASFDEERGQKAEDTTVQILTDAANEAQADVMSLLGAEQLSAVISQLDAANLMGVDLENMSFDMDAANDQSLLVLTQAMATFDSGSTAAESDIRQRMEREETIAAHFVAGGGF